MEPLGKKLQQVRLAKNISLEEAARVTKIRASRIEEIEAEDFSSFPSLAYAKGFLLIYGKFLDVDVTPYLDAFETSGRVTVDGYSYLQGENVGGAPPPIMRRQTARRPALLPLVVAVGVLVVGLYLVKLFLDIQRIVPPAGREPGAAATASASATASAAPPPLENIVAPRAIPVGGTPPSEAGVPAWAPPAGQSPSARATEPEVRRAEPVHPEELAVPSPNEALVAPKATPGRDEAAPAEGTPSPDEAAARSEATSSPNEMAFAPSPAPTLSPNVAVAAPKPSPSPTAAIGRVQIIPVRKTFVRVIIDNNTAHPAFEGWLAPSDAPLSFRAQHLSVRVLERGAIQVTKNGTPVRGGDPSVHIE
jgi:cytoskeletal protein RodZ